MDFGFIKDLILGNPVESGSIGLLAIALPMILKRFAKRPVTRRFLYKFYSRMNKLLGTFDIPVISGKSEETIKEAIRATAVDESIAKISAKLGYHPERLFELIKGQSGMLKWKSDAEELTYRNKK